MKIEKGMFSTVPVTSLDGEHPYLQVIYMRMCKYANESGQCRPSMKTLAKNCKISRETVKKFIPILVEKGYIKKTNRYNDIKDEYLSNIYDVYVKPPRQSDCPPRQSDCPPRQPHTPGGRQSDTQELYPYSGTKSEEQNPNNLSETEILDASEPSTDEQIQEGQIALLTEQDYIISADDYENKPRKIRQPRMNFRHEQIKDKVEQQGLVYQELQEEIMFGAIMKIANPEGQFTKTAQRFCVTTLELVHKVMETARQDEFRSNKILNEKNLIDHYAKIISKKQAPETNNKHQRVGRILD